MSIILLRSFVEVYRQKSVSGAANELGLTQPAVSGHISSLEALLERKLFTRHARGVKPTIIADELADRVGDAIDTAEHVLAEVKARSITVSGVIHLCGPTDILSDLISEGIEALVAHNLSVNLHPASGTDMTQYLLEGRADFAFAVVAPHEPRVDFMLYGSEELLLVARPEKAAEIMAHEDLEHRLRETPFVIYDLENFIVQEWLDHNRIDLGEAKESVRAPDLRGLCNLVQRGLGWSVLPRYLARDGLAAGTLMEVPGPVGNPVTDYYMLWLKSAMRAPRTAKAKSLLLSSKGSGATAELVT